MVFKVKNLVDRRFRNRKSWETTNLSCGDNIANEFSIIEVGIFILIFSFERF